MLIMTMIINLKSFILKMGFKNPNKLLNAGKLYCYKKWLLLFEATEKVLSGDNLKRLSLLFSAVKKHLKFQQSAVQHTAEGRFVCFAFKNMVRQKNMCRRRQEMPKTARKKSGTGINHMFPA